MTRSLWVNVVYVCLYVLLVQQGSPVRRMWGQQGGSEGYSSMSPATRRAQWGPAR